MSAPILSILVVNWNTKDLLNNCLRSIYEDPDSVNWEVVVVDNDDILFLTSLIEVHKVNKGQKVRELVVGISSMARNMHKSDRMAL